MKVRTRTTRGGFGEVAGAHVPPPKKITKGPPRPSDPGFHAWALDRLETIVQQEGLEARGVPAQIEMLAWDFGYGGVPLSGMEWLVELGRLEGVDVAAEHAAGREANIETVERLPMGQTCIPADGTKRIVGDLDATPSIEPGLSGWDPTIVDQVRPRLAARGYTLGRPLGRGTYAEVFEVEGRPDLVVKITSDANEAAAIAKINQEGYEGLPALARFFCVYALTDLPVTSRDYLYEPVHRTGHWVEGTKIGMLFVLIVERMQPGVPWKMRKAIDDNGLAFIAHVYGQVLDSYDEQADRTRKSLLKLLRGEMELSEETHGNAAVWDAAARGYAKLVKTLPAEQAERLERTVEELARRGILWFDLHSGNVMLDGAGNFKIIDLGVASDLGRRQIEADMPTLHGKPIERLETTMPLWGEILMLRWPERGPGDQKHNKTVLDTFRKRGGQIHGGLADRRDIRSFTLAALAEGQKVELEHTDDPLIALEIATDHIEEDPAYYRKLRAIERH